MHHGNFMQDHGAEFPFLAVPLFTACCHGKAEAHPAKVPAFGQGQNVPAVLSVRNVKLKTQAVFIFRKAQGSALGPSQEPPRNMVHQGENIPSGQSPLEGPPPDNLSEPGYARFLIENSRVAGQFAAGGRFQRSSPPAFDYATGHHGYAASANVANASGCRTATSIVKMILRATFPLEKTLSA
jgi:hypothetical protein